jgi:hypothetical protein
MTTRSRTGCSAKPRRQHRSSFRSISAFTKHTYQGNLDMAVAAAEDGLGVAARQAGWSTNWRDWSVQSVIPDGAGRFALYTLKALAFIHLRRSERAQALEILDALRELDPAGVVGWPVVAALAEGTS